jgi:ribosomal protein L9
MKVILLEDVVGAGSAGDVVEVANGYARNKLLPAGTAIEANKENMKTLEHRRAKIAAKKTQDKEMAQALANQIDGKQIDFTAKAGDSGKLFGSITAADIINTINETLDFELDRRKLLLDAPIKEAGMREIRYRVYPEVEAILKVNVLAEGGNVVVEEAIVEEESEIVESTESVEEIVIEEEDEVIEDDTEDDTEEEA